MLHKYISYTNCGSNRMAPHAICTFSWPLCNKKSRPSRRKCETKLVKHAAAAQPLQIQTQLQKDSCGALIASMSDIGGHLAHIEIWMRLLCTNEKCPLPDYIGCIRAAIRCDQNLSCEAANETIDSSNRKVMYFIYYCVRRVCAIVPTTRFELTLQAKVINSRSRCEERTEIAPRSIIATDIYHYFAIGNFISQDKWSVRKAAGAAAAAAAAGGHAEEKIDKSHEFQIFLRQKICILMAVHDFQIKKKADTGTHSPIASIRRMKYKI